MSLIPHLPALRRGKPYESLDKSQLLDHRTGNALASISQINAGRVIVSYIGHGAATYWAGTPTLFRASDLNLLSNGRFCPSDSVTFFA